jgi:hypothetical protein
MCNKVLLLGQDRDSDAFKIYVSDSGLLSAKKDFIEVKSADNTKTKSLKVYRDIYKPVYAIKLSTKNFSFEDGKKTVPLYAAFCI